MTMTHSAKSLLGSSGLLSHQAFQNGSRRDQVGGGILRAVDPRISLCQQMSGTYAEIQGLPDNLVRVQIQTGLCDHPVLDAAHGPSSSLHGLLVIHDRRLLLLGATQIGGLRQRNRVVRPIFVERVVLGCFTRQLVSDGFPSVLQGRHCQIYFRHFGRRMIVS